MAAAGRGDSSFKVDTCPCLREDTTWNGQQRSVCFTDDFCQVCGVALQFESRRISPYEREIHTRNVKFYDHQMHEKQSKKVKMNDGHSQVHTSGAHKFCDVYDMGSDFSNVAQSRHVGKDYFQKHKQSMRKHDQISQSKCQPKMADVRPNTISTAPTFLKSVVVKPSPELKMRTYKCHICDITFASLNMFRFHMQGSEHQIKKGDLSRQLRSGSSGSKTERESFVINQAKNARKIRDIREDEFAYYIKESRKIESKPYFRMTEDNYLEPHVHRKMVDSIPAHKMSEQKLPFETFWTHPRSYNNSRAVENQLSHSLPAHSNTYDSFQDELEDYIKAQKARGLDPKICFRKMRENYQYREHRYRERADSRHRLRMYDQRFSYDTRQTYQRRHSDPPQVGQLPHWWPADSHRRHDAYPDDCDDCIKVQESRELKPKTSFRRVDSSMETHRYREMVDKRSKHRIFEQRFPFETFQTYTDTYYSSQAVENKLPHYLPAYENKQRLGSESYRELTKYSFSEKTIPLSWQETNYGSHNIAYETYQHSFSNDNIHGLGHGHSYQASHRRRHEKRKRCLGRRKEKSEKEQHKYKQEKKYHAKNLDKDKDIQLTKSEAKTRISSGKIKHQKKKKKHDVSSGKGERKHKKEKKKHVDKRTEEEILWDESILGF